MKMQGNFLKAVDELMNGKFSGIKTDPKEFKSPGEPETDLEPGSATSADYDFSEKAQPDVTASPRVSVRRIDGGSVEAVITGDMTVKGNINSTANISISGTILGDVSSEGDVVVKGKVEGNITVHSLSVEGGNISGDIVSSGVVTVADGSSIDGNIKAERIEVNGRVIGNLDSATKIILHPKSVVEGNITALELSMTEGAELKGAMNVHKKS